MSKSDRRKRSRNSSRSYGSVPAFLLKTYEIIEAPTYNNLISWNKDGSAFIVKNANEFAEQVLPKYFKHNNFASFIRQLNMYDFHKVRHEENENEFKHKFFKRGQKHLLAEIKRKTRDESQTPSNQLVSLNKTNEIHKIKKEAQYFSKELSNLKGHQNELEKTVKTMHNQNSKLIDENKLIWSQLNKNKEKYEKRIEKLMYFIVSIMQNPDSSNALESFIAKKGLPSSETGLEMNEGDKEPKLDQLKTEYENHNDLKLNLPGEENEILLSEENQNTLEKIETEPSSKPLKSYPNTRSKNRSNLSTVNGKTKIKPKSLKRPFLIKKNSKDAQPSEMPTKMLKTEINEGNVPSSSVSMIRQASNIDTEVDSSIQPQLNKSLCPAEPDVTLFGATSANPNRFTLQFDNDIFFSKPFLHTNDEDGMLGMYPEPMKNTFKLEDKEESFFGDPTENYNQSSFMNNNSGFPFSDDLSLLLKRSTSEKFK